MDESLQNIINDIRKKSDEKTKEWQQSFENDLEDIFSEVSKKINMSSEALSSKIKLTESVVDDLGENIKSSSEEIKSSAEYFIKISGSVLRSLGENAEEISKCAETLNFDVKEVVASNIAEINTAVNNLVDSVDNATKTIKEDILSLKNVVEAYEKENTAMEERIDTLKQSLMTEIASINNRLDSIYTRIEAYNSAFYSENQEVKKQISEEINMLQGSIRMVATENMKKIVVDVTEVYNDGMDEMRQKYFCLEKEYHIIKIIEIANTILLVVFMIVSFFM